MTEEIKQAEQPTTEQPKRKRGKPFKPGQSGNVAGRPKGTVNSRDKLKQALLASIERGELKGRAFIKAVDVINGPSKESRNRAAQSQPQPQPTVKPVKVRPPEPSEEDIQAAQLRNQQAIERNLRENAEYSAKLSREFHLKEEQKVQQTQAEIAAKELKESAFLDASARDRYRNALLAKKSIVFQLVDGKFVHEDLQEVPQYVVRMQDGVLKIAPAFVGLFEIIWIKAAPSRDAGWILQSLPGSLVWRHPAREKAMKEAREYCESLGISLEELEELHRPKIGRTMTPVPDEPVVVPPVEPPPGSKFVLPPPPKQIGCPGLFMKTVAISFIEMGHDAQGRLVGEIQIHSKVLNHNFKDVLSSDAKLWAKTRYRVRNAPESIKAELKNFLADVKAYELTMIVEKPDASAAVIGSDGSHPNSKNNVKIHPWGKEPKDAARLEYNDYDFDGLLAADVKDEAEPSAEPLPERRVSIIESPAKNLQRQEERVAAGMRRFGGGPRTTKADYDPILDSANISSVAAAANDGRDDSDWSL